MSARAPVVVAAAAAAAVTEAAEVVVALRFPVFSLSVSLLLLRCLLPPPPSHRPPARLCPPPPPFYGEPISPAVGPDDSTREGDLASFLQTRQRGRVPREVARRCARSGGPAVGAAGRGGDFFLFSSAAADADAAVRETEPSMGPQPLKRVHLSCGGSAQPSFENGGLHSRSGCALTPACSTHRK